MVPLSNKQNQTNTSPPASYLYRLQQQKNMIFALNILLVAGLMGAASGALLYAGTQLVGPYRDFKPGLLDPFSSGSFDLSKMDPTSGKIAWTAGAGLLTMAAFTGVSMFTRATTCWSKMKCSAPSDKVIKVTNGDIAEAIQGLVEGSGNEAKQDAMKQTVLENLNENNNTSVIALLLNRGLNENDILAAVNGVFSKDDVSVVVDLGNQPVDSTNSELGQLKTSLLPVTGANEQKAESASGALLDKFKRNLDIAVDAKNSFTMK